MYQWPLPSLMSMSLVLPLKPEPLVMVFPD
jgi:hypothetical protein